MLHQYNYERRTSVHTLYFVITALSFLIELFELQELSRLKHICGNVTYILFIFPMKLYRRKEPRITKCVRECPTLLLHVAKRSCKISYNLYLLVRLWFNLLVYCILFSTCMRVISWNSNVWIFCNTFYCIWYRTENSFHTWLFYFSNFWDDEYVRFCDDMRLPIGHILEVK